MKQEKLQKQIIISIYDSFETDIFIDMEENNEDGADWRTTGIIIDYGIITRNGKSVDVVVTLFISLSMRIASLKRSVSSSSVSPQIVSSSLVSISFIGNTTLSEVQISQRLAGGNLFQPSHTRRNREASCKFVASAILFGSFCS